MSAHMCMHLHHTMNNRPPLSDMCQTVKYWHRVDTGYYSPSNLIHTVTSPELVYTKREFEELDPRLTLLKFYDSRKVVMGEEVQILMGFWTKPLRTLPSSSWDSSCNQVIDAVKAFTSFERIPNVDGDVYVRYERYQLRDDKGISYPCWVETAGSYVHESWLDKTYPGWEERYKIASSLGLDPDDLTEFVAGENLMLSMLPITDITFDYMHV